MTTTQQRIRETLEAALEATTSDGLPDHAVRLRACQLLLALPPDDAPGDGNVRITIHEAWRKSGG
jgi:hypothetical protein